MDAGIDLLLEKLSLKYGKIDFKNPLHIAEIYQILLIESLSWFYIQFTKFVMDRAGI